MQSPEQCVLDKVYLTSSEHPLNIFNADISSVSAAQLWVILFSEESVSRQRDGWSRILSLSRKYREAGHVGSNYAESLEEEFLSWRWSICEIFVADWD